MSGGSWDYVYRHFEEVASRLQREENPERRALGSKVAKIAKAMHAIEWVDSCDYGEGDDTALIREALGKGWRFETMRESVIKGKKAMEELERTLKEADDQLRKEA